MKQHSKKIAARTATLGMAAAMTLIGASSCTNNKEEETDIPAIKAPAEVVMDNILSRKSVRSFGDAEVSDEVVQQLLRAAMAAPTGRDVRPWRFVVLRDTAQYDTVFAGNANLNIFKDSKVVIVLCAETKGKDSTENLIWRDDMGACTENLLLAAEAYGLGAVWTACYPIEERMAPVRTSLGLPADVVPYAVVPIGYPDTDNEPKDKWDSTNVHYNKW